MGMIVVDASVAAKWVLEEHDSHFADELLVSMDVLVAPALIRLEVASAITRAHRLDHLSEQRARKALTGWYEVLDSNRLILMPDEDLLPDAIDIALSAKHALADCLYAAAAQRLNATLITADPKLIRRVSTLYPRIVPLNPGATTIAQ